MWRHLSVENQMFGAQKVASRRTFHVLSVLESCFDERLKPYSHVSFMLELPMGTKRHILMFGNKMHMFGYMMRTHPKSVAGVLNG